MRWAAAWPVLIVLAAGATAVLTFTGALPGVRAFVVLPFLLLCPGMAWVRLLRLESALQELTLAVALSLVLATAVAGAMLYMGAWSPRGSLAVLLAITMLALVLDATRRNQRHHRPETES